MPTKSEITDTLKAKLKPIGQHYRKFDRLALKRKRAAEPARTRQWRPKRRRR